MNSIQLFLNSGASVVIYTGGAGKGGSYTGLLKLKQYLLEGHSCAVVMRNKPDLKTFGGVFTTSKEILSQEIHYENKLELFLIMKNGATLSFLTPEEITDRKFDYIFVDNASQVDEAYTLDFFFKKSNKQLIMNTNSTKDRGFIFNLVKPYLVEHEDYYEFDKEKNGWIYDGVQVIHGTFKDNTKILDIYPDYPKQLACLSRIDKFKLLYGHYIKSEFMYKSGITYKD